MLSIILAILIQPPPQSTLVVPKADAPACVCKCGCATTGKCVCGASSPKLHEEKGVVVPSPPVVRPLPTDDPFAPAKAAGTQIATDPSQLPAAPAGKRWEAFRCFGIGKGCEYRLVDAPQAVAAPIVQQYQSPQFLPQQQRRLLRRGR